MNSFLLLIILFCCCNGKKCSSDNHHDHGCDHGWGGNNADHCPPVCHSHSTPATPPCPPTPCTPAAGARNQFFLDTQPRTCGCEEQ